MENHNLQKNNQDFDRWNEIKKKVDADTVDLEFFPKEGEVWMCILGKNIGREQNGGGNNFSRAMFVVKKFNNEIFWALSLSTRQKEIDYYYNFVDINNEKVSVILAQIRLVHIKRFKRKMYDLSGKDINNIKKILREYLV